MAKKITIENLAVMVKKGFDGMDKRFDSMDKRFDNIEKVLLKKHDDEIADLRKRMTRIEDALVVK